MEQKSIVLTRYPYTDLIDYKIRPCVIISNADFNKKHSYYLVCPITSKQSLKEYELKILEKDLINGVLKTESFVRSDDIAAIEKDRFLKEIGIISTGFFKAIIEKIKQNF